MKKTLNINLGMRPFIIDEDAYQELRHYLDQLEAIFNAEDPSIVTDIEYRFAEILQEKIGPNQIVTLQHIQAGIEQVGTVESISNEPTSNQESTTSSNDGRLYRDEDHVLVSGVSSGIAHYLGIKEKIIVRLIFAFTLFTPFTLIYLVLWAILPTKRLGSVPMGKFRLNDIISEMIREVKLAISSLNQKFNRSTSN